MVPLKINPAKKNKNFVAIFLIFPIIFLIGKVKLENCQKDFPIITSNLTTCQMLYCTDEEFKNKNCLINNPITKIQWLNKKLILQNQVTSTVNTIINKNNELILIFSIPDNDQRLLYIMNTETDEPFERYSKKIIEYKGTAYKSYSTLGKFLIDNDEYIIDCSESECEIYDYTQETETIISVLKFTGSKMFVNTEQFMFNPDVENNPNKLILGSIAKDYTNYYLTFVDIDFSKDEDGNIKYEIINKNNQTLTKTTKSSDYLSKVVCFKTENSLIVCIYVNPDNKYYIAIFNTNLDLLLNTYFADFDDSNSDGPFNYCAHLQKEIGVCTYFESRDLPPKLKVINIINNNGNYEFDDLIKKEIVITIDKENNSDIEPSFDDYLRILKITQTKFAYSYLNIDDNFIVIVMCDLYGETLNNINLRYYRIYFELYGVRIYGGLSLFKYNRNFGLAFLTNKNNDFDYPIIYVFGEFKNEEKIFNLGIIKNNYEISLNDSFNITINNNLFGYEFKGFKIITMPNETFGIILEKNNTEKIKLNDILSKDENIIINSTNINAKITQNFTIEIVPIIEEPEYSELYLYTDKHASYGEEDYEKYYSNQKDIFIGKKIKYFFSYKCHELCETCEYIGLSIDKPFCTSCKKNYCYLESENNCFNISELIYKYYIDKKGKYICIPKDEYCPSEYPFLDSKTLQCKDTIHYDNLIDDGSSIINDPSKFNKTNNLINNLIKKGLIDPEGNFNITGTNITIQVTTSEKTSIKNKDKISNIDLGECETILKNYYNISRSLIIYKIDIRRNDTVATQVEYEVINPYNYEKLNLSLCKNAKINIYSPVYLDNNTYDLYKKLEEQGYDLFDSKDSFYNDLCTPFDSENETDVLLRDRKKDYYNSEITFCETGCAYKYIDTDIDKVLCECNVKTEIQVNITKTTFSINELAVNFYKLEYFSNILIITCYKLTFSKEGQIKNYGSFIILSTIIIFLCLMVANQITGIDKATKILDEIIDKLKVTKNEKKQDISLFEIKDASLNDNINELKTPYAKNKKKFKKSKDINVFRKSIKIETKNFPNEDNTILGKKHKKNHKEKIDKSNINPPKKTQVRNSLKNSFDDGKNQSTNTNNILKLSPRKKFNNIFPMNENNKIILRKSEEEKSRKSKNHKNKKAEKIEIIPCEIEDIFSNNGDIVSNNKKDVLLSINKRKRKSIKKIRKLSSIGKNIYEIINNGDIINSSSKSKEFKRRKSTAKNAGNSYFDNITIKQTKQEIDDDNLEIKKIEKVIKFIQDKNKRAEKFNSLELNLMKYDFAWEIDTRNYFQYYWSLIKLKHVIISTFFNSKDYNIFLLKFELFIISFDLYFCVNCLFFSDDTMHKLYESSGSSNILYQLPQIFYSSMISTVTLTILKKLSLSQKEIMDVQKKRIFKDAIKDKKRILKCLNIKFILFSLIGLLLMGFFWYYLSAFCSVYKNSQMPLIKDTLMSYGLSMIYPIFLNLLPGFFRIPALRDTKKRSSCMYNISKLVALI